VIRKAPVFRRDEDWQIVLIDAARKPLIRFSTPDDAYVADPETAGFALTRPARDAKKWIPVFREDPALQYWNRSRL
jgi:hypothetical protein